MNKVTLHGMTWDHNRGYDPMVATANKFAQLHPNVEIIWHKRSLQAFADRPLEEMTSEFDLMVIDHPHAGAAAESGLLLPLDGNGYDKELELLAKQSVGQSHPSYFDKHQWALAIDAATPVAAYRPDLLPNPPKEWEEVVALAEAGKVVCPLKPIDALMCFYNVLANRNTPFGKSENGIDTETGVDALNQLLRMSKHLDERCFTMNPIGAYEWLASRDDAVYIPYLYGYSNYGREGFRQNVVRSCDAPAFENHAVGGTTLGGTGIAISSTTEHKDVALKYAFWIASAEIQKGIYFNSGGQPGNLDAWVNEHCNTASSQFFKGTLETLENAYVRPRHNGYLKFQDEAGDWVNACLQGKLSPEQTVENIQQAFARSKQ
ncbi:extracellular solute-binding protein [Vibrio nigripulchritudo]|uniref:extracellular solute-binding protein n=1 Tax=Vibrio nigripulchritudo TaxID=28173 RepID=UPI0003B1C248|nr:extracellular solute-binding protein [Vibrio nigripulchritudo]CCN71072.1 putative ABC-type sugar transport system,periplasmic component [Vibrio nigripulchritudo SFn118]